ncbi:MAG: carboxypeptidase-like regulatory domain-containing protein [Acidobacteriota bacterium]|nr:carboxypeptidase-like regulatory domain-containing protein [Acidobacteriota bacterium]
MNHLASRWRAKPFIFFSVSLIIVFFAARARAQDLDGVSFGGAVADQNGALIPGATVTATLLETKSARAVTTDGEGRYRLFKLTPGVYSLRAERAGFAAEERKEISTVAGQQVRLDFTLRPAGVVAEQTVVSDSQAPPLDTTRTVVGGTLTREEVERLPQPTRSPLDFVFTLGGVTEEPLSVRVVSRGGA